MNDLENNFSIYPYSYNELLKQQALQESHTNEERHRRQLADELSVNLGTVAMAAVTGIAGPEYKEVKPLQPTVEQTKKLGSLPVRQMIAIDRPSFMNSLAVEQASTLNERAILGYAEQQNYRLAA